MRVVTKATRDKISKALKGNNNGKNTRIYSVNYSVFNRIDTEEKAYWLGFIMADGYVYKNAFGVKLSTTDLSQLYYLRDFLQSEHPIKPISIGNCNIPVYHSLVIVCKDLVHTLKHHGVLEKKSTNAVFPETIPEHLEQHFIRGVFDGDGWITKNKCGLAFGIMGTRTLIERIQDILIYQCQLNRTKLLQDKRHKIDTVSVNYGGNIQCMRIYDYIYDYGDCNNYLERKQAKWIHQT